MQGLPLGTVPAPLSPAQQSSCLGVQASEAPGQHLEKAPYRRPGIVFLKEKGENSTNHMITDSRVHSGPGKGRNQSL